MMLLLLFTTVWKLTAHSWIKDTFIMYYRGCITLLTRYYNPRQYLFTVQYLLYYKEGPFMMTPLCFFLSSVYHFIIWIGIFGSTHLHILLL